MYRTDLTARPWDSSNDLFLPAKSGGRPRTTTMRHEINPILYLRVTGAQWHMLPKAYPAGQTVDAQFVQWNDDGPWQHIHDTCRAAPESRTAEPSDHGLSG